MVLGTLLEVPGRSVRLSALGLRRDPHGTVKQIHHQELEDGDKERPSAFPKIMFKQTDSGIQQFACLTRSSVFCPRGTAR
jgi:hypothetical protein